MPDTTHTPEKPVAAVADLSDDQAQSLETFKSKLSIAGWYQPASDDTPASHDDTTLLYVPL